MGGYYVDLTDDVGWERLEVANLARDERDAGRLRVVDGKPYMNGTAPDVLARLRLHRDVVAYVLSHTD